MERLQAARQHIGPAIVAVHGRGGAVGDRIAERHDGEGVRGRGHLDRIEEEPRCGRIGEGRLVFQGALGAGAWRADIGGGQRLGVPGHRTTLAGDVKAHREPAAGKVVGLFREWQCGRIAPDRISRRHGDGSLAAKRHRAVGAAYQRRTP